MKKKDIPLNRENVFGEFFACVMVQLLFVLFMILDDLIHGKGFETVYLFIGLVSYLYSSGVRDFGEFIKVACIFSPLLMGVFFALRGIYYKFKRRIILKYGKRYDATIIAIEQVSGKKDYAIHLSVRYRKEDGEFKFYKNPGLNPFTDYRIVSKACSIYVLGRSKYVTDFVLAPKDLVEEFKKLIEELGSEELAMEELKRRYGDTGDNSRIGGY